VYVIVGGSECRLFCNKTQPSAATEVQGKRRKGEEMQTEESIVICQESTRRGREYGFDVSKATNEAHVEHKMVYNIAL
jgi:hypothetical protein